MSSFLKNRYQFPFLYFAENYKPMKLLILLALVGCVFAYGEMWCQMSAYSGNIVISGYTCGPINAPLKYQSVAAREYPQT
jgi:hypothetical protein